MKGTAKHEGAPRAGDHLRKLVRFGSLAGLSFSLLGTGMAWAGTDSFRCSTTIWKTSLALNLALFALTWVAYLPFRNTDRLLGNGLLTGFMLINMFWMFGFGGFYFYFLCAPINFFSSAIALVSISAILLRRAFTVSRDISEAFQRNNKLFGLMYYDEGATITFKREAIGLLEKNRRDRNPFKSLYAYAAIIVAPFVFVLNRVLTPVFGDGHGVFLVLAFFAAPMLLWGVGIFTQTVMTMIYYPIKLQRETGKPVLLKDW